MQCGMSDLRRVVGALQQTMADRAARGALVAFLGDDGILKASVPPPEMLESPEWLVYALPAAAVSTAAIVLPVRTLWREDVPCDYLDAEALVIVAAEVVEDGVLGAGVRCPIHQLPDGWVEAHDDLQWLSRPLRAALAGREIEETEA